MYVFGCGRFFVEFKWHPRPLKFDVKIKNITTKLLYKAKLKKMLYQII